MVPVVFAAGIVLDSGPLPVCLSQMRRQCAQEDGPGHARGGIRFKNREISRHRQDFTEQHQGRFATDRLYSAHTNDDPTQLPKLKATLHKYYCMYRLLLPRGTVVSQLLTVHFRKRNDSLARHSKKKEHSFLGKNGFTVSSAKIEDIEKELGIYALSQFTPH